MKHVYSFIILMLSLNIVAYSDNAQHKETIISAELRQSSEQPRDVFGQPTLYTTDSQYYSTNITSSYQDVTQQYKPSNTSCTNYGQQAGPPLPSLTSFATMFNGPTKEQIAYQQAKEYEEQKLQALQEVNQACKTITNILGVISKKVISKFENGTLPSSKVMMESLATTVIDAVAVGHVQPNGLLATFEHHPLVKQYGLCSATLPEQAQLNYFLACSALVGDPAMQNIAIRGIESYVNWQSCSDPFMKHMHDEDMLIYLKALTEHTPLAEQKAYLPAQVHNLHKECAAELVYFEQDDEIEVHQTEKLRIQARKKAIDTMVHRTIATTVMYSISEEEAGFLLAHGYNHTKYTQMQGTLIQQQLHAEIIEQIQQVVALYQDPTIAQQIPHLSEIITSFADLSYAANCAQIILQSAAYNDTNFAWLNYAQAVSDGIALGAQDLCSMISHPKKMIIDTVQSLAALAYMTLVMVTSTSEIVDFESIGIRQSAYINEYHLDKVATVMEHMGNQIWSSLCNDKSMTQNIKNITRFGCSFALPALACKSVFMSLRILPPLLRACTKTVAVCHEQLPQQVLRIAGSAEAITLPAMQYMQQVGERLVAVAPALGSALESTAYALTDIKPLELYKDASYLSVTLTQAAKKGIKQVADFAAMTKNFTVFSELSTVQMNMLELYGWFYENCYQGMQQKLAQAELFVQFQGEKIAVDKAWPLFHSFVGEVPIAWNRKAQPTGAHFNFCNTAKDMYEFVKIEAQATNFVSGKRSFIGKLQNKTQANVTTVVEHPLELFDMIIDTLMNPTETKILQSIEYENQFMFQCKGQSGRLFAYTMTLVKDGKNVHFKIGTLYEILEMLIEDGKKWKNM